MISCRIDVSKIDKSKIVKGEKGQWYDFVVIESPNAKYGNDHVIIESTSKEEREAGKKGTILGNGKTIGKKLSEPPTSNFDKEQIQDDTPVSDDDLPF